MCHVGFLNECELLSFACPYVDRHSTAFLPSSMVEAAELERSNGATFCVPMLIDDRSP